MWNRDVTKGLNLGPVLHFNNDLEEFRVEVALEKPALVALGKQWVVSDCGRQVLGVVSCAADQNGDLKLLF